MPPRPAAQLAAFTLPLSAGLPRIQGSGGARGLFSSKYGCHVGVPRMESFLLWRGVRESLLPKLKIDAGIL